ncbi:MAG: deoxyribodipyrimidine photolyase [Acidithiobacillus sp.]|nr:MAG: deoxyribodipyrimidine photolyase [Acidithiobacillus sp.]
MRGLHWFRNDLRLKDNRALGDLFQAVDEWCGLFVLEPRLIDVPSVSQKRLSFLFECLEDLSDDLDKVRNRLVIVEGPAETEIPRLMHKLSASVLSFNEGTTPFARSRDQSVVCSVKKAGHRVLKRRDHVIFAATDIRSSKGSAYSVYTPYRNAWWKKYSQSDHSDLAPSKRPSPIADLGSVSTPQLLINLKRHLDKPAFQGGHQAAHDRLNQFLNKSVAHYHQNRDRPDLDGTSRLSMHLRFGTISVRECFKQAMEATHADPSYESGVQKWLDELIWREFYNAILEENPRVLQGNYRQEYDYLNWRNNPKDFSAWCEGRTGFPIVDAGIRQLLSTGWMHNRIRMIVASFLTKDLLTDWKLGERFFFEHLVDGDPASNNGGWQWAASTGTNAQPYFRIFNPWKQSERWDPKGDYIRRWVTELRGVPVSHLHSPTSVAQLTSDYPTPIVDHASRRTAALMEYRKARERNPEAQQGV